MDDKLQIQSVDLMRAFELGAGTAAPELRSGQPGFVLPAGWTLVDAEPYEDAPRRIRQLVKAQATATFLEYASAFKSEALRLFADIDEFAIYAVFDYHTPAPAEQPGLGPSARWGSHALQLTLKKTPEWLAWEDKNKRQMSQIEFAEHLEENQADVVDPVAAKLLEVVQELQLHRNIRVRSAVRTQSGQTQLKYEEDVDGAAAAAGSFEIPTEFGLGLKPFYGGDSYKVRAYFRYRAEAAGGKLGLKMWYALQRPELVLRDAFESVVRQVKDAIGLPVHFATLQRLT